MNILIYRSWKKSMNIKTNEYICPNMFEYIQISLYSFHTLLDNKSEDCFPFRSIYASTTVRNTEKFANIFIPTISFLGIICNILNIYVLSNSETRAASTVFSVSLLFLTQSLYALVACMFYTFFSLNSISFAKPVVFKALL